MQHLKAAAADQWRAAPLCSFRCVYRRANAVPSTGQQTPDNVPAFKLVLVGDGGTGAMMMTRVLAGWIVMPPPPALNRLDMCLVHVA